MRIFSLFFHPERKTTFLGGAEKRFLKFLEFLNSGDYEIKVLVLEFRPSLISGELKKVEVLTVDKPFRICSSNLMLNYFSWILWGFKAVIRSLPAFFRIKPDLILSPNNTLPSLFPAFLIKLVFRKPLCVVVHHFDFTSQDEIQVENFLPTKFFRKYQNIGYSFSTAIFKALASFLAISILRKANKIISVSKFSAKTLLLFGFRKENVLVSGNGVDFHDISKFYRESGKKVFDGVFVGRVSLEKGIYDLVDAWRIIVSKWKRARLAIVGEGPELENLKTRIRSYGLEGNIVVFGGLSDREMYRILCKSKVFIFPSRFEGWGLAVSEALACGLPVVCYKIPALEEVFGKCKSVFFVSKFDSEALARKIVQILENFDKKSFGRISRNFAKNFVWEKIFEKDLTFLRKIG
ncbi:hypothetical protein DRO54_04675 [Candidatus Bathyarchaeota archaeon]|nr:MAG: hypothetical protein DRO54_04675 [Candidatus Bathyarchaeota archaeon]